MFPERAACLFVEPRTAEWSEVIKLTEFDASRGGTAVGMCARKTMTRRSEVAVRLRGGQRPCEEEKEVRCAECDVRGRLGR